MTTNERVKAVRQAVGLSQRAFAQRVLVSYGYIGAIELGRQPANDRLLRLIATEFCVSEHWLRTGKGEMFAQDADTKANYFLEQFRRLSSECQDFVLRQMEQLLALQDALTPPEGTE